MYWTLLVLILHSRMSGSDDPIEPMMDDDDDIGDVQSEPGRITNENEQNGNPMASIMKRGQSMITVGKEKNSDNKHRKRRHHKADKNEKQQGLQTNEQNESAAENGRNSNSSGNNVNNHSPLASNGNDSHYGSVKNCDESNDQRNRETVSIV